MSDHVTKERLEEIREEARHRGPITLRCPLCRHYLTGIVSPRGDYEFTTGERGNLYCTWPDCSVDNGRVKVRDAVRGHGPKDGSGCCTSQKARQQRVLRFIKSNEKLGARTLG